MAPAGRDRWFEVDALFRKALDREPEARDDFLAAECGDDEELLRAVRSLLRAEARSTRFLTRPVGALTAIPWDEVLDGMAGVRGSRIPEHVEKDRSGERIGPYRLVRRIGRGGMATVYLAERADGLWEQQVALKLIRRGLDTRDVVRRFLSERQILSSLGHPNIARLLDGGTTDEGLPFLVMEFVAGTPVTDYCDGHRLTIEERLGLFCDVGRAVQYAHRSLVVHRDLKPSNILVTEAGRVKLLDFGIAKILDPAGEAGGTRTGSRPLTPEWASPEQVLGGAITTASDVYQLGLLLYELLSGHRPRRTEDERSPSELASRFEAGETERPSSLVDDAAARARSTREARLVRRLRGDLDTVVRKAVLPEPEARYPSAEALVADVERHLAGLPIAARPPTVAYRTRKLLRRRPWILPVAAAALLALVGYVFTLVHHANELERERNLAHAEAERAEEVQRFLVEVFRSVDPYAPGREVDRDITVRAALALGTDRVRGELRARPELQARLLGTIGDVYANLDLIESARELRAESLVLQREVHGPRSIEYARGLRKLGALMIPGGRPDSARTLLGRSLAIMRAAATPEDTAVAGVLTVLGDLATWEGRHHEAEAYLTEAAEMLRDEGPGAAAHLAAVYTELLDVYPTTQRMDAAREAAEEAARLSRIAYGEEHPRTALSLVQLADVHDWDGRSADAARVYGDAIEILDRTLGPEHARTLEARNNLAVTLRHLGRLESAETVHRAILAAWRAKSGDRDRQVADALQNLAVVLHERGALDSAEERLAEARDLYDSILPSDHYRRAYPRLTLASVHLDRGAFVAAERAAREATGILSATMPETSYVTATARCRTGRALLGQGRRSEARSLLESGVRTLAETTQPSVRYEVECRRALADLYRSLGREDLARRHGAEVRRLQTGG